MRSKRDQAMRLKRWAAFALVTLVARSGSATPAQPRALLDAPSTRDDSSLASMAFPIAPQGKSLTHALLRVRSCVPTHGPPRQGQVALRCMLASVAEPNPAGGYEHEPRQRPTRMPDPYAEVSAFFHAMRALAFFERIGLPRAGLLRDAPLDIVVGARVPHPPHVADAAVISRPRGLFVSTKHTGDARMLREQLGITNNVIWLGFGQAINVAYDADTVIHEVCHAVLDSGGPSAGWTFDDHGASREPEAIVEAVADYFTAAITGDGRIAEYTLGKHARDLRGHVDPAYPSGHPHRDGLPLARALWRTRRGLSNKEATTFDRTLAQLMRSGRLGANSTFADVARLLDRSLTEPAIRLAMTEQFERRLLTTQRLRVINATSSIPPLHVHDVVHLPPGATGVAPAPVQFRIDVRNAKRLRGSLVAVRLSPSPWSAGDNAQPLTLGIVIAWDKPIRWDTSGSARPVAWPLTQNNVFDVAVPTGAQTAYIQVVNRGHTRAAFRRLVFSSLQ